MPETKFLIGEFKIILMVKLIQLALLTFITKNISKILLELKHIEKQLEHFLSFLKNTQEKEITKQGKFTFQNG